MLLVPLTKIRLRLIDDYHKAWKFSSMRFLAIGAACQAAVMGADRIGYSQHVPDWVLSTLSTIAVFSTLFAALGRVTTTEPRKENEDDGRHEHI